MPLFVAGFWARIWDQTLDDHYLDHTKTIGLHALYLLVWTVVLVVIYGRHFT